MNRYKKLKIKKIKKIKKSVDTELRKCYTIECVRQGTHNKIFLMREWLSGGVSPCQGEGRGFESRLALFLFIRKSSVYYGLRIFCYLPS